MKRRADYCAALAVAIIVAGCGTSREAAGPPPASRETLYAEGHRLYLLREYDSAATVLKSAAAMDSSYAPPVADLAALYYDAGMSVQGDKSPERLKNFRQSRACYTRLETLGSKDAEVYDRLCELAAALDDNRAFLAYARKNVEHFPYDRQYYNLGVASFQAGEFAGTVKAMKEAIAKFPLSQYIGGYYRHMGLAYTKMDRDQTAERTFNAGVDAVNARVAGLKKENAQYRSTSEYRRLAEDKIGMLLSLRRLHQTYRAEEKLKEVDRQLKEAGHDR